MTIEINTKVLLGIILIGGQWPVSHPKRLIEFELKVIPSMRVLCEEPKACLSKKA